MIRTYREGDENKIFELYCAVHPERKYDQKQWLKWWHWKFCENPAGSSRILLYEDGSRIIAQYPLVPSKIKVGNRIVKAWQNVDLMTHPFYLHRGIFTSLEKQALADDGKDENTLVTGFPNRVAHQGHLKANWFDVARMKVMVKPLSWKKVNGLWVKNECLSGVISPVLSLFFKRSVHKAKNTGMMTGLTITGVSSFDERNNELWGRLSGLYPIMAVRDRDYLNWRYAAVPGVSYHIYTAEKAGTLLGYLVMRNMEQRGIMVGVIFDIFTDSVAVTQRLVAEAVQDCREEKIDVLYYGMIAGKTHGEALRKNGFISMPFPGDKWFSVYSGSSEISKEQLKNHKNWFIQLGDSDMI